MPSRYSERTRVMIGMLVAANGPRREKSMRPLRNAIVHEFVMG